jgi:hypothetical protein
MSDKKISQLPSATTPSSTDLIPLVQASGTTAITLGNLFANIPIAIVSSQAAETPTPGTIGTQTALATAIKVSLVNSTSGSGYYTLAIGTNGLIKTIACSALTGTNVIVTVASGSNFTTITFTAIGQTATLDCIGTTWYVRGVGGKTLPTIA